MKKIFAIAMLGLLLFNLGGYSLLFQYFIDRSDTAVYNQINNNNYKPADLVEVKIPVHLPAIENWTDFSPVSGQLRVRDTCYNYAQLKMTRDTMYLMCIPNNEKAGLKSAKLSYAKQVSDIPSSRKSRVQLTKQSISDNEYNYSIIEHQAAISGEALKTLPDYAFLNILKASIGIPGQPPEVLNTLS